MAISILILICAFASAQTSSKIEPKVVTVPATIDHDRAFVDVNVALPDGSTEKVEAWIDSGNPDLYLSRRLATVLGLKVTCDNRACSATPPKAIEIGGMTIPLNDVTQVKIPLRAVNAAAVLAPGMKAEMTIPSTALRHYDVLLDFPEHKFTIGQRGTIHFQGSSTKAQVDATGLVEIPAQIEKKKITLALDLGSSMSFVSPELFDSLGTAHADWPHMTGAIGPANVWGADDETKWKLMRVDRLQAGPLFLTDIAMAALPDAVEFVDKPKASAGILGANVLQNYRVGIDYARSMVYFDIGRTFNFPDFDVVGVTLRPEGDGRYTIVGVVEDEGKPAVDGVLAGDELIAVNDVAVRGSTMGQVWAMLGGDPGQERRLTIGRGGKQFVVTAAVRHFMGAKETER